MILIKEQFSKEYQIRKGGKKLSKQYFFLFLLIIITDKIKQEVLFLISANTDKRF